jgi:hypothetical protein
MPFAISVLDKDGKRITGRHQNWLQLRPGEIITCNGCHDANSGYSHGRVGSFDRLYQGAPGDGYIFPNTESAIFANFGETMADARSRIDATAMKLSVDLHYQDVWTDESAAGRPKDAPLDYTYAQLDPNLSAPVSDTCQSNWDSLCRIIINYEQHIHPLWNLDRGAGTCTTCHTNTAGGVDVVPAGQLDLTDGASDLNADHFKSYRELVSQDLEEVIDIATGNLVIREEPVFDVNGLPVFLTDANGNLILDTLGNPIQATQNFPVAPSMRIAGAAFSGRFFDRFSDPADTDHFGRLSPAELKLLAEWLDIGGQYYNNPFDVPP